MDILTIGPMTPFVIFFIALFYICIRGGTCPDCGEHLSGFIWPSKKTKRQWLEGGYVCPNCGCDVSMDGEKVPANAPLRFRRQLPTFLLLGVLVVAYVALHMFVRRI